MHAYLTDRLAIAVQIARYVDGGVDQLVTGAPFEPTRTPSEATTLAIASSMVNTPDNGPNRMIVVRHGLGLCDFGPGSCDTKTSRGSLARTEKMRFTGVKRSACFIHQLVLVEGVDSGFAELSESSAIESAMVCFAFATLSPVSVALATPRSVLTSVEDWWILLSGDRTLMSLIFPPVGDG